MIPNTALALFQASSLSKIDIGQLVNMKYDKMIANTEANRLYPNGTIPMNPPTRVISTIIPVHSPNLVGSLCDSSSPLLLKNRPLSNVTLFIAPKVPKAIKAIMSANGPSSKKLPPAIAQRMVAMVAILNNLSREVNLVRMLLIFKNSIKLIIIQKSSWCKQSILGMLLLLCSTSTYATTEQSISSVVASVERRYNIPKNLLLSIANLDKGVTNIDIGLLQINWRFHGKHFKNISEILDTKNNIDYAASFLRKLYNIHGSWREAVRYYHSARPEHHRKYSRKIITTWLNS